MSKSIVEKLDIKITRRSRFKYVSSGVVEYPVAKMNMKVENMEVTSLVVVRLENTTLLLGTMTLELLGFKVAHSTGKLKPLELMLL